jgi:FkbM family methyltransferase
MKTLGFLPQVIFDCGAFLGDWSVQVSRIFPGTRLVLMEPNKGIIDKTRVNVSQIKPDPLLLEIAVGDREQVMTLNVWGDKVDLMTSSSLLNHVIGDAKHKIETEVKTLDKIAETTGFVPDVIKLDLQGAELSALQGAISLLETTELFIIEFGCLEAYVDRTTPRDLMDIMYDNDYCLYDVVDLMKRAYDQALSGGDFFFLKKSSKLRKCEASA